MFVLTGFFEKSAIIFGLMLFFGVRKIPLPLSIPLFGAAVTTVTMVLFAVLGIGLSGFFIYANEEDLVL